jgi:hypothetical protein
MASSGSEFTDQIIKDRRSSDLERTDPSRILLAIEVQEFSTQWKEEGMSLTLYSI